MKKQKKPNEQKVIRIETAAQLKALIDAPVYCKFGLDGQQVEVACQRMSPSTTERVRSIRRKPQPPFVKDRGPHGDYDHTNAKYLEARDQAEILSRAVIIYSHCPAVSKDNPGLSSEDEILKHVQSLFSETVLETIALTIQMGGLSLEERVNFT